MDELISLTARFKYNIYSTTDNCYQRDKRCRIQKLLTKSNPKCLFATDLFFYKILSSVHLCNILILALINNRIIDRYRDKQNAFLWLYAVTIENFCLCSSANVIQPNRRRFFIGSTTGKLKSARRIKRHGRRSSISRATSPRKHLSPG